MSVLIPTDQLTLTEKARLRSNAVMGGIARAVKKLNCTETEVDYRMAQNIADFGTVGRERWLTQNLALINANYSMWTTLAAPAVGLTPQLAVTKVAVFWGVSVDTTPNPVSLLSFRKGVNAGTTFAVFGLEELECQLVMEGYFSVPVVYDPQDVMNVVVTSKIATLVQAQVVLNCYIFERKGDTTS